MPTCFQHVKTLPSFKTCQKNYTGKQNFNFELGWENGLKYKKYLGNRGRAYACGYRMGKYARARKEKPCGPNPRLTPKERLEEYRASIKK